MTPFQSWLDTLEKRYLADLTFREVSRGVKALSTDYVERRARIADGGVLSGSGKRAAFALFYGPLHFLIVERIAARLSSLAVSGLHRAGDGPRVVVDLGCGTGAAAAAWASGVRVANHVTGERREVVLGIDKGPWALAEAASTYRHFGLSGRTRRADIVTVALPRKPATFLAAFTMNELADVGRDALLLRLLDRARQGDHVLILEPLAGFVAPWWDIWCRAFESAGGRADEWRFRVELPPLVLKLDRAAGLNHEEVTGRTLWLGR